MGWRPPARDENGGGRRSLWCRGVRRRACSGRSVALSMTWELRYPDLCFEHAEQTLDRQAPLRGVKGQRAGGQVVTELELVVERCAGIDVHQAQLRVCVRLPGDGRRRVEE